MVGKHNTKQYERYVKNYGKIKNYQKNGIIRLLFSHFTRKVTNLIVIITG
jgi:hypothetical protein